MAARIILEGSEWVKVRSKCTVEAIFERLRNEVENDVAARQALNDEMEETHRFAFDFDSKGDIFSACLKRVQVKRSVRFKIVEGVIQVRDQDNVVIIEGRATVSDDGVCRIKVGDMELDSWQFRRRALERLFFELP